MAATPPGFYPTSSGDVRWWNGTQWADPPDQQPTRAEAQSVRTTTAPARAAGPTAGRHLGTLLYRPWWTDWIFYLWLFAIIALVVSTVQDYRSDGGLREVNEQIALVIDIAVGVVVQTLFFLCLPSGIRRAIRRIRSR